MTPGHDQSLVRRTVRLGFATGGAALDVLAVPGTGEGDEAHRAEPEHLERVPRAQQHDQMQPTPAGTGLLDVLGQELDGCDVGSGEQHCGDAPLEAAAAHHGVADAVRRQEPVNRGDEASAVRWLRRQWRRSGCGGGDHCGPPFNTSNTYREAACWWWPCEGGDSEEPCKLEACASASTLRRPDLRRAEPCRPVVVHLPGSCWPEWKGHRSWLSWLITPAMSARPA